MKKEVFIAISVVFICIIAAGSGAEEQTKRVMNFLAVMDLRCGKEMDKQQCAALTEVLIGELVKTKKYTIIDRANRDKILSEAGFQQTGCVDNSCTIEMGRVLGVGKMVVGSISKLGQTYLVNVQLLNVESAAVETAADEECKCNLDGLISAVRSVARKLMGEAPPSQPPAPTPPAPPNIGQTPSSPAEMSFIPATPDQQRFCTPDMVYIPAGWFLMGCNSARDSQCESDETPSHTVYLDAYCIDRYEYPNQPGALPKEAFSWQSAQGICNSSGKRLPMEAEWEKAARGTDGRLYPWGDYIDEEKKNALKNYYSSGAYSWNVSPYGVYDMSGSVWEWIADWYDGGYYAVSAVSINRNPTGPSSGQNHVLRGGHWFNDPARYPRGLRASFRDRGSMTDLFGFRCAKSM